VHSAAAIGRRFARPERFRPGLCSLEWARLTGRSKCVEIIDKYMDKMQLNP
jgi:hypothetical protein